MGPTADISTTEFFAALNQHCEGMLELRGLPSKHQQYFDDSRSIGPFLIQHAKENIYFGVATRRDNTNGRLENCQDLGALFMDLDFKGYPEEEARKMLEEFSLPPSIVIHSGGGLHLYWRLNEPLHLQDQEDCRQAYSYLRRLAAHLHGDPAAAEPARILRVPGTTNFKYTPPRPVVIETFDPSRIYDLTDFDEWLPKESSANSNDTHSGYSANGNERIADGDRNDFLYRNARSFHAKRYSETEILEFLLILNNRCDPPLGNKEVEEIARHASSQSNRADFAANGNGARTGSAAQQHIAQEICSMNDRHAVVMFGGKCGILNEDVDPQTGYRDISLSNPADFHLRYADRTVTLGDKPVRITALWLKDSRRRQFDGIIFAPDGKPSSKHYNLWRGFAVEPLEGDCGLYLQHVFHNIASQDSDLYLYIIRWMASLVQHPSELIGTSLVLRGKQGVGKGVFVTEFGKLLGQHFLPLHHARHLTGHFNSHLKDKLLVFSDEGFWAGDKQGEGALKALVTESRLPIEFKGKDVITVKNHVHLIVASNNDWVVPTGFGERRFCVIDVNDAHKDDHSYFRAITDQMNNGGREALLYHLQHIDLSDVNLRTFPKTTALWDQTCASMHITHQFIYERLLHGAMLSESPHWEPWVIKTTLHHEFVECASKAGVSRRGLETGLGVAIKKLLPGVTSDRRTIDQTSRVRVFNFPSLEECRAMFEEAVGQKIPWHSEDHD
jgi:hypothetical protein